MEHRPLKKIQSWIALATLAVLFVAALSFVYLPIPPPNAPTVLVSVDRTLWNRTGLNRLTHVRALRDAGLRPVLIDFEKAENRAITPSEWLAGFDGLILGGGGDVDPRAYGSGFDAAVAANPQRDEFELALLDSAERLGLPVLGICRGAQLINVYRGGTLGDFRADSSRYGRHHRVLSGHPVDLLPGSRLSSIFGATRLDNVVTFHGQHVDVPGRDVHVVGYAPDGTPEAIEVGTGNEFGMLGVQWHAEVMPWDPHQARLFRAFAEAAAAHRSVRVSEANVAPAIPAAIKPE